MVPAATITTNNVVTPNPVFTKWTRQDRLIYSALLGAISTPLQPVVSRTTSASQILTKLASTYSKPSHGHIKQLKTQLKNYTKGSKTINDYLQGITTRLDQLAILGKPMDHEDAIELILEGLPEEYKMVVDQIEGKDTPLSLTEVHERLLNHETKILSTNAVANNNPSPVSANNVRQLYNNNKNSTNTHYTPRYDNNNNTWQSPQQKNNNTTRVSKPYLGKYQSATYKAIVPGDIHNSSQCNCQINRGPLRSSLGSLSQTLPFKHHTI